jgi:DNA-binding transcriptional regulator YiaG
MTPDELLQRYPRETLRWLRGRLGLSQLAFALRVEAEPTTVARWERGRGRISLPHHRRLVPLLAPHLATAEGRAWLAALQAGRDGAG